VFNVKVSKSSDSDSLAGDSILPVLIYVSLRYCRYCAGDIAGNSILKGTDIEGLVIINLAKT
jgi:hypothetical protein